MKKSILLNGKVSEKNIIFLLFGIVFFLFILLLIILSISEKPYQQQLCFTNKCFYNFYNTYSFAVNFFISSLGVCTVIIGIFNFFKAVETYQNSVKNGNISNNIITMNAFKEYVEKIIDDSLYLSTRKVDILKWYSMVFKNSKESNFSMSWKYGEFLRNINDLVAKTNKEYKKRNYKQRYNYKSHQAQMKKYLLIIGIEMEHSPRLAFYEIEDEVRDMINSVNNVFLNGEPGLIELKKRDYS